MSDSDLELEKLRLKRMQQMLNTETVETPKIRVPDGIVHLSDVNFESFLNENSNLPVFVDFWAEWQTM